MVGVYNLQSERSTAVQKIRVLIADHDPIVVDGLRSILRPHEDIEVVGEAASLPDLTDMIDLMGPHLILMDGQIPGLDTIGVIKAIKQRSPEVKVLLMAVHNTLVGAALDAGADAFIIKNSARDDLLRAIRRLGRAGA